MAAPCRAVRPGRSHPLTSALPKFSQGREQELESRQQEAEAADKERKASAQRHQRDLAQEAARLQGIADQQQVCPLGISHLSSNCLGMASGSFGVWPAVQRLSLVASGCACKAQYAMRQLQGMHVAIFNSHHLQTRHMYEDVCSAHRLTRGGWRARRLS